MKSRFLISALLSLICIVGIATPALSSPPTMNYLEIEPVTSLPCNNGNRYAPNMQVRIQGQGFSANAAIHSEIMADFGHFKTTLGPFTADEQGRLDTIITIPENTPLTGGARLLATGLGANDGARLLFVWIALVASSEPNTLDNGIPDICGKGNTTSSFTGRVWLDANGNGIQDANENGLAGVTVFLDYAETGVYDNGEPSAITDSTGHYAITRLQTGGHY